MTNGVWEFYEADDGIRVEWDYLADTEGYPVVEYASDISGTYFGWFSYLIHYGPMPYINEYSPDIDMHVFPVPANDILTIRWNEERDGKITIFDVLGQPVMDSNFTNSEAIRLNVSSLKEGSYLYRIDFSGKVPPKSGKVIIQ
jgi:hypothetical protein